MGAPIEHDLSGFGIAVFINFGFYIETPIESSFLQHLIAGAMMKHPAAASGSGAGKTTRPVYPVMTAITVFH